MEQFVPILVKWSDRCSYDEHYVTGRGSSPMRFDKRPWMPESYEAYLNTAFTRTRRQSPPFAELPPTEHLLDDPRHPDGSFEKQSDSGYGTFSMGRSLLHGELDKISVIDENDLEQAVEELRCNDSTENDMLDNMTEFSDAGSLTMREKPLANRLIKKIKSDLNIRDSDQGVAERLKETLPELFRDFAVENAQQTGSQFSRDMMFHVWKNKE